MSETIYACTHIGKHAEEDSFSGGCQPDTRVCVMCERCHITADSLPGLIEAIGEAWCLDMDDVWVPQDDGKVNRISYNRLEYPDGQQLNGSDPYYEQWKKGEVKAFLADYDFAIEKRSVEPIPFDEFKENGIKFHE